MADDAHLIAGEVYVEKGDHPGVPFGTPAVGPASSTDFPLAAEGLSTEHVGYTLSVAEFRQVSYALNALANLLTECNVSVSKAHRVVAALDHANEAMKMLHGKNP